MEEELSSMYLSASGKYCLTPGKQLQSLSSIRSDNGPSRSPSRSPGQKSDDTGPSGNLTPLSDFQSISVSFAHEDSLALTGNDVDSEHVPPLLLSTPELNRWISKGFLVPLEAEVLLYLLQQYPHIVALGMTLLRKMVLLLVSNGGQAPPTSPLSSSLSSVRRLRSQNSSFGSPKTGGKSPKVGGHNAIAPETRVRAHFSVTKCGTWGYVPRNMLTSDLVSSLIKSNNSDAAVLGIRFVTRATVLSKRPAEANLEKWIVAAAESSGCLPQVTETILAMTDHHQGLVSVTPHVLRKVVSDGSLGTIAAFFDRLGKISSPVVIGKWEMSMLSAGLEARYKTEKSNATVAAAGGRGGSKEEKADLVLKQIIKIIEDCLEIGTLRFSSTHAQVLNIKAIAANS